MRISKCKNQEVDVWVVGHLVTQFQGQILRAAANNRVRGHAFPYSFAAVFFGTGTITAVFHMRGMPELILS